MMTREICKMCGSTSPLGFSVPDEIWQIAIPSDMHNSVLCIMCFAKMADKKLIQWDNNIQFFPVSLSTLNNC